MRTLLQDVRYGARMLLKKPGFTFVAVLVLALGIGANTALFSVVNGVLLRPLPYSDPERIVTLWERNERDGIARDDVSPANFLDWQERAQSFSEIAFANPFSFDYTGGDEPEVLRNALVSRGFFQILGTNALHGRTFLPEEYEAGKSQVVVLGHGLWQRRFGGDPKVVGRTLALDDKPYTVVGVMPPEFRLHLFDKPEEMWSPQILTEDLRRQRKATYLKVIARLKPGATVESARAEMDSIAARLAEEHPSTNQGVGITTVTLPEQMTGAWRPALLVLLGAVGCVLLIACANVASLLLARGAAREREFAIRSAVGASRQRLVRQLLTENLLLAATGCAGGLVLAAWGVDLIVALNPADIPRIEQVGLDGATLGFAVGISLLTALVFGLVPALAYSKTDLNLSLKDSGRGTTIGAASSRLRGGLVIMEIALSFVLLIGAGLLLRSFVSLLRVDPGFAPGKVLALQTFIWDRYTTPEQRTAYVNEALERVRSLPGVEAAGVTTALPLLESSSNTSIPLVIEGQPTPQTGQEPVAQATIVTGDYFPAMGVRLLGGRLFNTFDTKDSPKVALINETMRRRYWAGEDPLGRKFTVRSTRGEGQPATTLEVVGVVGDLRHEGLDKEPRPEFFRPHTQSPSGSIIFVVRTANDPASLIASLKARLWEINRTQPFYFVSTMEQLLSDSLKARRFSLTLFAFFAALALMLAVTGIYGVMSFTAGRRTHEIGVRMALGARRGDVLKLVIGQGMRLALVGVVIGSIAAFALTRLMSSLLYGISANDPATFAGIALLLIVVALAACYFPARRAARVDPLVALRHE
jgi:putative ABC transport system permease protein